MNRFRLINYCILFIAFLLALHVNAADKISIYTTNYPLKYFTERIAGKHATVEFPLPTDIDPAFWNPNIETIIKFQNADLIILNGASYEKWMHKVSLPQQKVIDTSSGFKNELINTEESKNHSHGREGEHTHSGTAFTTWLDLSLAVKQVNAIYSALDQRYPQYMKDFKINFERLKNELLSLDQEFSGLVKNKDNVSILASHPVYQYMQRRYNLNLESVLWEPDTFPSNNEWQVLNNILETFPAKWMIWEKTPALQTADKLKKQGIQSIEINPCANAPSEGDFMSVMDKNIRKLSEIFNLVASNPSD